MQKHRNQASSFAGKALEEHLLQLLARAPAGAVIAVCQE
jgi:hypothetical protein